MEINDELLEMLGLDTITVEKGGGVRCAGGGRTFYFSSDEFNAHVESKRRQMILSKTAETKTIKVQG